MQTQTITRKNLNAADGSFLGFLFQIERVIMWLSELGPDAVVGIEVADDIVVRLNKGDGIKEIYEQAKHTTGKSAPFTDKGEALWKTLSNWIMAINNGNIKPENAKFSLLSSRPIPTERLVQRLSNAGKDDTQKLNEVCHELVNMAGSLRKGLKSYGQVIQQCPPETLALLVSNITIIDSKYHHKKSEYDQIIKHNLPFADLPYDNIMDSIFGHLTRQLIELWQKKEEAWITVSSFNTLFTNLIVDYKKKPFVERAADLIPVSKSDIQKNKGKAYVEQIKAIECKDDEILEAIHDYLRSLTERDRFAKDGEISSDKFDEYYADLVSHWQVVSRPRFRFADHNLHVKIGYETYYEVIRYKGKLNSYEPEQSYTYRGAYHFLANELKIGWHPNWEDLFIKK
jgi:hypothetical protein